MNNSNRLMINLKEGAFEIEGSQEFIQVYSEIIDELLTKVKEISVDNLAKLNGHKKEVTVESKIKDNSNGEPESLSDIFDNSLFGEVYHKVRKGDLGYKEKALIGAYFLQKNNDSNTFKTRDVTKLLKDQGVKMEGTSTYISRLVDDGLVFKVSGRELRVSENGENYIFDNIFGEQFE